METWKCGDDPVTPEEGRLCKLLYLYYTAIKMNQLDLREENKIDKSQTTLRENKCTV